MLCGENELGTPPRQSVNDSRQRCGINAFRNLYRGLITSTIYLVILHLTLSLYFRL